MNNFLHFLICIIIYNLHISLYNLNYMYLNLDAVYIFSRLLNIRV